jgi:hypothetical protein
MITGTAFGYGHPDYIEAMSQREAAEKQRQMGIHMGQYAHNMAKRQEYGEAIQGAQLGEQRKQSGVTREMQQLEKNLHVLAAAIDNLDNRLASICIPAPETASGLRSTGEGCALANQLAGFNSMLLSQITRIEMLYQGVDL